MNTSKDMKYVRVPRTTFECLCGLFTPLVLVIGAIAVFVVEDWC